MASALISPLRARFAGISDRRILTGIFLLALAVRGLYLFNLHESDVFRILVGDGFVYDRWATAIAQGDWRGHEVFYQAPLYPYFLAIVYTLFGHDPLVVRIVQIVAGSMSCVFLACAARNFLSVRSGLLAGAILAVYAPAIYFDGLIQKASLDLFFSTLLLLLLSMTMTGFRRRWMLVSGLTLGLFILTRENALILVPIIVFWVLFYFTSLTLRKRLLLCLVFAAGLGATLLPVGMRNLAVGGNFLITTSQFGPNFYIGNHPGADGEYIPLLWGHGSALEERDDATRLAEQALGRELSAREVSDFWVQRAFHYIRSEPGNWLGLMARKMLLVWNAREIPDSEEPILYYDHSPMLRVLDLVFRFGIICPLAFGGVVATRRQWRKFSLLYFIAGGFALSVAVFFVFARYRYPMVPVLIILATAGIRGLVSAWEQRSIRRLVTLLVVIAASAVFVNWNLIPNQNPRAMAHYNMGVSLDRAGNLQEAASHYAKAVEHKPDYVQAHINLGVVLARTGRTREAVEHYQEALRLSPDNAYANNNLGNVLKGQGRIDEALECYLKAVSRQPDNPKFWNNLGAAQELKGLHDQALESYLRALELSPNLQLAREGADRLKKAGHGNP